VGRYLFWRRGNITLRPATGAASYSSIGPPSMPDVETKKCSKCARLLPVALFNRANWIKSGHRSDCKDCYAKTKREYWERKGANQPNRARRRALRDEAQRGVRTCRTCARALPLSEATFGLSNGWWNSSCRECVTARTKEWAEANADRAKTNAYANCARRYAGKRQRTPGWLTPEHRAEILSVYAECRRRRGQGENLHVDHIVPLVGKTVSGLHVPWNLQIVPASYNVRKSNKLVA
jgi:hypothetical protein